MHIHLMLPSSTPVINSFLLPRVVVLIAILDGFTKKSAFSPPVCPRYTFRCWGIRWKKGSEWSEVGWLLVLGKELRCETIGGKWKIQGKEQECERVEKTADRLNIRVDTDKSTRLCPPSKTEPVYKVEEVNFEQELPGTGTKRWNRKGHI